MKDKNPISGEEEEAYTVEIECEAESPKYFSKELANCPYGEEIMDLLKRASFIPKGSQGTVEELAAEAKAEEEALTKREEELREEGRKEIRFKYVEYLRKKNMKRATEALGALADEENEEKSKEAEEKELEHEEDQRDRDEHLPISPHFGADI